MNNTSMYTWKLPRLGHFDLSLLGGFYQGGRFSGSKFALDIRHFFGFKSALDARYTKVVPTTFTRCISYHIRDDNQNLLKAIDIKNKV